MTFEQGIPAEYVRFNRAKAIFYRYRDIIMRILRAVFGCSFPEVALTDADVTAIPVF